MGKDTKKTCITRQYAGHKCVLTVKKRKRKKKYLRNGFFFINLHIVWKTNTICP